MGTAFKTVDVRRVRHGTIDLCTDRTATEEPLEVRLHGEPFAVIMRTPGNDCELAAGFLFAERILRSADDLGAIAHCTEASAKHPENIVNVTLTETRMDGEGLTRHRRATVTSSSCGLCGRASIESLRVEVSPITTAWTMTSDALLRLPSRLRATQHAFDETGGLHAAGLFTSDGRLEAVAEDVGRHNAVDKVIGRMLMAEALPLNDHILFVSGRTSFEIVQKAFLAGIPLVASVSAPSSLAVELAEEAGITLVGFVRGDRFNVYTHSNRVVADGATI